MRNIWGLLLLNAAPLAILWSMNLSSLWRRRALWAVGGLSLILGWISLGKASLPLERSCALLWSFSAAGYAFWAGRRLQSREKRRQEKIYQKQREWEELRKNLEHYRTQVFQEKEKQQQSLTLYGIIRGLSEALDWDSMRPKLEQAIEGFLGLKEFALYVADHRSPGSLYGLIKRRLWDSAASSWDRLEKLLGAHQKPP